MNLRWLLPIMMTAVGFALGYSSGHRPAEVRINEVRTVAAESPTHIASETPDARQTKITQTMRQACAHASTIHRLHRFTELFAELSEEELELAARAIGDLPAFARDEARQAMVLRLASISPEKAVQFIESSRDDSGDLATLLVNAWGQSDPENAFRWYADQMRGQEQRTEWALQGLARRDPERAVNLALSDPALYGGGACRAVFEEWSKTNPAAALARAMELTNLKLRADVLAAAAQGWAASEPAAALAWFRGLQDSFVRSDAAPGLARGLAQSNFAEALQIVQQMPASRRQESAMAGLAEELRSQGKLEEAFALVSSIAFDPKNDALRSFYFGTSMDAPAQTVRALLTKAEAGLIDAEEGQAISQCLQRTLVLPFANIEEIAQVLSSFAHSTNDELTGDLTAGLARNWAGKDSSSAIKWAESLPVGAMRERAISSIAGSMAWNSPSTAADWLQTLATSPDRNAAIAGFAFSQLRREPGEAMALILSIPNMEERLATLRDGWERWHSVNREAAEKWRDESESLNAVERAHLKTPHVSQQIP